MVSIADRAACGDQQHAVSITARSTAHLTLRPRMDYEKPLHRGHVTANGFNGYRNGDDAKSILTLVSDLDRGFLPNIMDENEIKEELTEILHTYHPDKKVRFADDFTIEDMAGLADALHKTNRRLRGKLGWFWRLYYRPRRV